MRIGVLAPLEVDERNAPLGSRDRIVLTALAIRPGELLTPGQLADAVWGDGHRRPGPRTSRLEEVVGAGGENAERLPAIPTSTAIAAPGSSN
jgi:hypothetical protein